MSSFTDPLKVEVLDDGRNFRLLEEFDYEVGSLGSGEVIHVPAGFVTDFASIPRILWSIIGAPEGPYGKAAVVHDYLYVMGGKTGRGYTKAEADKIFQEAMGVLGVGNPRRWLMYHAVKMFGKGSF